jgi:hypothetical protein
LEADAERHTPPKVRRPIRPPQLRRAACGAAWCLRQRSKHALIFLVNQSTCWIPAIGTCDLTFIICRLTSRRWMLERKLQDAEVPVEEQNNILKHLEKKETEYMRLQRHKMGVEDFELLTIIGRGAFGEVQFISVSILLKVCAN